MPADSAASVLSRISELERSNLRASKRLQEISSSHSRTTSALQEALDRCASVADHQELVQNGIVFSSRSALQEQYDKTNQLVSDDAGLQNVSAAWEDRPVVVEQHGWVDEQESERTEYRGGVGSEKENRQSPGLNETREALLGTARDSAEESAGSRGVVAGARRLGLSASARGGRSSASLLQNQQLYGGWSPTTQRARSAGPRVAGKTTASAEAKAATGRRLAEERRETRRAAERQERAEECAAQEQAAVVADINVQRRRILETLQQISRNDAAAGNNPAEAVWAAHTAVPPQRDEVSDRVLLQEQQRREALSTPPTTTSEAPMTIVDFTTSPSPMPKTRQRRPTSSPYSTHNDGPSPHQRPNSREGGTNTPGRQPRVSSASRPPTRPTTPQEMMQMQQQQQQQQQQPQPGSPMDSALAAMKAVAANGEWEAFMSRMSEDFKQLTEQEKRRTELQKNQDWEDKFAAFKEQCSRFRQSNELLSEQLGMMGDAEPSPYSAAAIVPPTTTSARMDATRTESAPRFGTRATGSRTTTTRRLERQAQAAAAAAEEEERQRRRRENAKLREAQNRLRAAGVSAAKIKRLKHTELKRLATVASVYGGAARVNGTRAVPALGLGAAARIRSRSPEPGRDAAAARSRSPSPGPTSRSPGPHGHASRAATRSRRPAQESRSRSTSPGPQPLGAYGAPRGSRSRSRSPGPQQQPPPPPPPPGPEPSWVSRSNEFGGATRPSRRRAGKTGQSLRAVKLSPRKTVPTPRARQHRLLPAPSGLVRGYEAAVQRQRRATEARIAKRGGADAAAYPGRGRSRENHHRVTTRSPSPPSRSRSPPPARSRSRSPSPPPGGARAEESGARNAAQPSWTPAPAPPPSAVTWGWGEVEEAVINTSGDPWLHHQRQPHMHHSGLEEESSYLSQVPTEHGGGEVAEEIESDELIQITRWPAANPGAVPRSRVRQQPRRQRSPSPANRPPWQD